MPRTQVATIALATLALAGCGGSMLGSMMGAGATEAQQDNYYSYVTPAAPQPGGATGLVVGSVALENVGSVFHIQRIGDGAILPLKLAVHRKEWRKLGPLRVAFLPKKNTVETREVRSVFAGAIPSTVERRRELPRELQTAGILSSIALGNSDDMTRAVAFSRQYPSGWFVVALPPGEYQLVSLEGQYSESNTARSQTGGQTTVATRDYSVASGPRFSVTAGRSNYIGSWHYTQNAGTRRVDEQAATAVVSRELSRINQTLAQWPLVTVGAQ